MAGPDVQNAEKNDRGEEGEVSWQKSILVIILRLLWSSIDAYDGRVDRCASLGVRLSTHSYYPSRALRVQGLLLADSALTNFTTAQCVLCKVRCHCIFSGPRIRYSGIFFSHVLVMDTVTYFDIFW